jgi:hypothetical protein
MQEYHLLLVDDDPFILEGIGEELENNGRVYPKEGVIVTGTYPPRI